MYPVGVDEQPIQGVFLPLWEKMNELIEEWNNIVWKFDFSYSSYNIQAIYLNPGHYRHSIVRDVNDNNNKQIVI